MSDDVEWQRIGYPGGGRDPLSRLADFTQLVLDSLNAEAVGFSAAQRKALVCYLLGARDAAVQQSGSRSFGSREALPDVVAGWLSLAVDEAQALGAFCRCVPEPPAHPRPELVDQMCREMPAQAADIRAHAAQVEEFLREPAGARAYWKGCWGWGFDEFLDWLATPDGFEPRRAGAAVAGAEGV